MPEETYFGQTLPDLTVTGSAWEHRQAVKKKKGREVAKAVREGRDAMAKEVSYWLPVTGTARFIADTANDIKEGDYAGAALNTALAVLPFAVGKALSPAKRMVAGKLLKREPLKIKGKPRVSVPEPTLNNEADQSVLHFESDGPYKENPRWFVYKGTPYHRERLLDGSYRRVNLPKYDMDLVDWLYRGFNLEDASNVQSLRRELEIPIPVFNKNMNKNWNNSKFGNTSVINDKTIPVKRWNTFNFYRGSHIPNQEYYNNALPHEVHHGLSRVGRRRILKSQYPDRPPFDFHNMAKVLKGKGYSDNYIKSVMNYFDMPQIGYDEVAARGTQLMDYYKIRDASTPLTADQLEDWAKNPNVAGTNDMEALAAAMGERYKSFAEWLSKYATTIVAALKLNHNDD